MRHKIFKTFEIYSKFTTQFPYLIPYPIHLSSSCPYHVLSSFCFRPLYFLRVCLNYAIEFVRKIKIIDN